MKKMFAPQLLSVVSFLENNRYQIAQEWVLLNTVLSVFKAQNISAKKFQKSYAVPIIEYFISVVREDKEAGNCPIMSKLVAFLLQKEITPKNVFDVCMGLRRTLVSYLFKNSLVKDEVEMMDEIATIFDANLSGVLEIFTEYYERKLKLIEESKVQQKKFNQVLKIINFINTKIIIIQSGHIIMANKPFFEMIGVENLKELYRLNNFDFSFMKNFECASKKYNFKNNTDWIDDVMKSNKAFKTDIFHHKYNRDFKYSGRITTLPNSEPLQYLIALHNIDTHIEEEIKIRKTLEYDPLTGFYTSAMQESLILSEQSKSNSGKYEMAFLVIEVGNLENPKVLLEIVNLLKSAVSEEMIVAHIQSNKFGIAIPYLSAQDCYDWCNELYIRLYKDHDDITVSLTSFDHNESLESVKERAFDLLEIVKKSAQEYVSTDFLNIELYNPIAQEEVYITILKDMQKVKTTLYYQDIPISAEHKILKVHKSSIELLLSKKELKVANISKIIYLELPSIGHIKASIDTINKITNSVSIYKFKAPKHLPLDRKIFRISATVNTEVRIILSGSIYIGTLMNVNHEYIAVRLERKRNLDVGLIVSISVELEINKVFELLNCDATIYKIEKINHEYEVVFLCHLDSQNSTLLNKYIANRQLEVIHELKSFEDL